MRRLLTQKVAESAKPTAKPYQLHDTAIPGLILRVQPTGTKTWKLIQDRKPRTLGRFPIMTHAMAAAKAEAILRGEDPDAEPEAEPMLTLGDFFDKHYRTYAESHHSRPDESLRYVRAFGLDDKPLDQIRQADVETWRHHRLSAGKANTTVNRQIATLKAALQLAVEWDLLPANPLRRIKPLKVDKRRMVRYLLADEERRLLAALVARDDKLRAQRDSGNAWRRQRGYDLLPALGTYGDALTPMVLVSLHTGLRRGELQNLQWADVDLRRHMLTVRGEGAKSKQSRHLPLNKAATDALKTHKGSPTPLPTLPVFGRHDTKKAWAGVLLAAGIERFRWHDLRHSFASKLVSAGVPLNTIRELMGHASLDMTLVYAHLAPDDLRAAVDLLGDAR